MSDLTQYEVNQFDQLKPATDAQRCAEWAQQALAEGRYQLGAEMARLADRANRVGARPAGHEAAQRDLFGQTRAVPLIGRTRDEQPRDASHAPQVCAMPVLGREGGLDQPCAMPIRYSDGSNGSTVGWYHLTPGITDHEALPEGAGY